MRPDEWRLNFAFRMSSPRCPSSSWPGLTRPSILFGRLFRSVMDTRVKPAYDDHACRSADLPHDDFRYASPRRNFPRQHQNPARARPPGPGPVEFGDQLLVHLAADGALQRGPIDHLIHRLMQRGIASAPKPPRLHRPQRFCGIRKMLPVIPLIERPPFAGIGDGGADDVKG